MKKSLFALAALTAFAGAAQAQSSSVTLYGVIDAGIRNDNNAAAAGASTAMAAGVLNTSRFGFKGTEDLGGGLKANFNLESGFSAATGASSGASLFDRRAIVGLEGAFGKVDLGRNTTLTYDMSAGYVTDPLGNEFANQNTAATFKATPINPINLVTGSSSLNTVRRDNSIKYVNTFGPTTLALMYAIGGQAGDTGKNESLLASLRYTANGLDAGIAYDDLKDNTASKNHQKTWTAGGNYTVSGVKATVGYSQVAADAGFTNNTGILNQAAYTASSSPSTTTTSSLFNYIQGATSATTGVKMAVWDFGLGYNFTPALNVVGAYYNTKYSADGIASQSYDTFIVRGKYALSKRTDLYAALDYTKSKDVAAASTVSHSDNATGVTVGVQHRF